MLLLQFHRILLLRSILLDSVLFYLIFLDIWKETFIRFEKRKFTEKKTSERRWRRFFSFYRCLFLHYVFMLNDVNSHGIRSHQLPKKLQFTLNSLKKLSLVYLIRDFPCHFLVPWLSFASIWICEKKIFFAFLLHLIFFSTKMLGNFSQVQCW